jgi:hypothetical protein
MRGGGGGGPHGVGAGRKCRPPPAAPPCAYLVAAAGYTPTHAHINHTSCVVAHHIHTGRHLDFLLLPVLHSHTPHASFFSLTRQWEPGLIAGLHLPTPCINVAPKHAKHVCISLRLSHICDLQDDGNLVAKDVSGVAYWASGSGPGLGVGPFTLLVSSGPQYEGLCLHVEEPAECCQLKFWQKVLTCGNLLRPCAP